MLLALKKSNDLYSISLMLSMKVNSFHIKSASTLPLTNDALSSATFF